MTLILTLTLTPAPNPTPTTVCREAAAAYDPAALLRSLHAPQLAPEQGAPDPNPNPNPDPNPSL
eukprot:scaffold28469_cov22-Phaeocystis_antarctica.AAC.2